MSRISKWVIIVTAAVLLGNAGMVATLCASLADTEPTCTITKLEINKELTDKPLRQKPMALLPTHVAGLTAKEPVKPWRDTFGKVTVEVFKSAKYKTIDANELTARIKDAYDKKIRKVQELAPLPRILIGYIAGPNIPTDTTKPNVIKAVGEFLDVDYLVRQIVGIEAVPASGNTQQSWSTAKWLSIF